MSTESNFVMQSVYDTETPPHPSKVKILRATHLGMCFGVRDAIALALEESKRQPLTILGELVHNQSVVKDLRERGIDIEDSLAAVKTGAVMITAHGASEIALDRARAHGLHVLEATCPLVHFAHRALRDLVQQGYHPVIIGKRGHVEVRGLTEDLADFDVVLTDEDIAQLPERSRIGILAQTTQPISKVRRMVELIRRKFPRSEIKFSDTVCQPTKQRQTAAIQLAQQSDIVVVIGGEHSNNTRELATTCQTYCGRVYHVQNAADLHPQWFEGAGIVGITAGTSTPDYIIDSVEFWLNENL